MTDPTTSTQTLTAPATTPYGLELDRAFGAPADEEQVQRATAALSEKGYTVHVVDTAEEARTLVSALVPTNKSVFTSSSETLRLSGIDADINESGNYDAVRPRLTALREAGRYDEMRVAASAPDYVLGSFQAVTEAGQMLAASGSGSQLSHYSYSAGKAIWVVGTQKIVPNLDTALRRIDTYAYPLEDERFREHAGAPAVLAKILIINRELFPDRGTIVFVREPIGF
ncbi:LUD domain-containing protein [Arthrobacter globiformis]|uniref:LUD domain-containing protein n=1 Tax=Arthrobacter globiformis TaxID=1665 RepID=UPI000B41D7E7|nr:LUD domain-containing protein [Arthrobacter globiformis]